MGCMGCAGDDLLDGRTVDTGDATADTTAGGGGGGAGGDGGRTVLGIPFVDGSRGRG